MVDNNLHKLILFISLAFLLSIACSRTENTQVLIYSHVGEIELELYNKKAPLTTSNFLEYVEKKLYDNSSFYRTVKPDNQPTNQIKIEVIQGGLGFDGSDDELPPIYHESTLQTGVLHENGTISMARMDTGTVTSEFFICIGDQPELDFGGKRNPDLQGFAAFGRVTSGMEWVRLIQEYPDSQQLLISPVLIDSIRIIK